MRRLREKLHSESGASIILAMLLFLVCCMVAVSILAAVMSNAGKSRSNQAEQQKYLTLSSAIQLVADEIENAEYTWKYTVYEWDVAEDIDNIEHYFYCRQDPGTYECGDLTTQLPLQKSLEGELKIQFPVEILEDGTKKIKDGYRPLDNTNAEWEDTTTCKLLVTLPDGLNGYSYPASSGSMEVYQVPDKVTVRVELNHTTHHIRLTAWLGTDTAPPADASNTMIAELVAAGDVPTLSYINPVDRTAGREKVSPTVTGNDILPDSFEGSDRVAVTTAKTMKWKLNWIKKGGL